MRSKLHPRNLHPAIQACGIVSLYATSTLLSGNTSNVWAQNATLPVPAASATAEGSNPLQTGLARFEIEFQDIPVTELLIAIAKQGGVEISIQGDVSGTLKFVSYRSVTAEEAIERVAADAGLFWGRRANQYVVTKSLDALPVELQKRHPPTSSRLTGAQSSSPIFSQSPAVPQGIPPLSSGNWSGGISSPTQAGTATGNNFIPDLYEKKDSKDKQTRVVRVHNVPPRMMAYWLDPAHNAPDNASELSQQNFRQSQDKRTLKPAFSAGDFNLLQNPAPSYPVPYPGMMVSPGRVASPYVMSRPTSPYAMSGSQTAFNNAGTDGEWRTYVRNGIGNPYTQARPQFGFGGGGQQGGFGGGQQGGFGGGGQQGGFGGQGGQGGGQQIEAVFDLPEGIESMAAVDAQNALLIRGTAAAVEELQTIIDLLDQPLKQVEVEAQFVTLTTSETKSLGINFNAANGPFTINANNTPLGGTPAGSFVLGYAGPNFQAQLGAAIGNNRQKIVASPRIVAINNLTASIFTTVTNVVLLNQSAINPGNGGGGTVVATAQVPFQITTSVGISVTPTINGDGTITVLMQPQVQLQGDPIAGSTIPSVTSQQIQTVALVRDGDTIALGGLRNKRFTNGSQRIPFLSDIPILGKLFRSVNKSNSDEDLIIFLTARIVRRLSDDDLIPGTF